MFQDYISRKQRKTEELVARAWDLNRNAKYLELSDDQIRRCNLSEENAKKDPVYQGLEKAADLLQGLCASGYIDGLRKKILNRTMTEPLYAALFNTSLKSIERLAREAGERAVSEGNSRAQAISIFEGMILEDHQLINH